jgi:hypothetical protein
MQKINGLIYFSASDVVNFLECEYLTTLDLFNLETPLPQTEDDEEALLYQSKGIAREAAYFDRLKEQSSSFADISGIKDDPDGAVKATRDAMHAGVKIIFHTTATTYFLTLRPRELPWAGDDARAGLKAKDIKDLNEHERRLWSLCCIRTS